MQFHVDISRKIRKKTDIPVNVTFRSMLLHGVNIGTFKFAVCYFLYPVKSVGSFTLRKMIQSLFTHFIRQIMMDIAYLVYNRGFYNNEMVVSFSQTPFKDLKFQVETMQYCNWRRHFQRHSLMLDVGISNKLCSKCCFFSLFLSLTIQVIIKVYLYIFSRLDLARILYLARI